MYTSKDKQNERQLQIEETTFSETCIKIDLFLWIRSLVLVS